MIKEIISWGQLATIIALLVFVTTISHNLSAALKEKADKEDLKRVEEQSISKDCEIKADFQRAIGRIETLQQQMLELLM